MEKRATLTLDMAGRVNGFTTRHPDDNPVAVQLGTSLSGLIQSADTLADQQRSGLLAAATGTARKAELRQKITADLNVLIGVARAAARTDATVTLHRRMPRSFRIDEANFVSLTRVALREAGAQKDILLRNALPVTLLDDIAANLDEFQQAVDQKREGAGLSIGARAELTVVIEEIIAVVRHMNTLNRRRFAKDAELLAAWNSARNIAWPNGNPEPAPTSPDKKAA